MRHWLVENEEWIALAIGIILVTVLTGVLAYIVTRRRSQTPMPDVAPPPPAPPPPPPSAPRISGPAGRPESVMVFPAQPRSDLAVLALQGTRPRLQEILGQLRRTPARQRDILIDSFLGFPVTCAGEIKSAVKLPSAKLLIDLSAEDTGEDVFFEVHPSMYPTLDLTAAGARVVASGRFRCSASVVWLDDVELAV
jgi:hypothetical protein